jgi:hypothetical protein
MKMTLMYLLVVGSSLLSATAANAITHPPAQIVSNVSTMEPAQTGYYSGTDAPLPPTEFDYIFQVRLGSEVYDVRYESAIDFFPGALMNGASFEARLKHGRLYLEIPTGELEASIIGKHQAKADTLAQLAR